MPLAPMPLCNNPRTMIREAIANYINAKAEKLRHTHKWEIESRTNDLSEDKGGLPTRIVLLYYCRECGEHKKITLPE